MQFEPIDFNVGDVKFVLRDYGAGKDEAPMTVRRDNSFRVSFDKVAVFAPLNMIAEATSERAGKGLALLR